MKNLGSNTSKLIILIVAIAAIGIISSKLYLRFDVTHDHAYTLSEGSKKIASKIERPVEAKFYFSKSVKEVPPMIKEYGKRIEDVLHEYAAASGGKITVDVIDPKPDTDEEEWANKYGIQGMQVGSGSNLYIGIVFLSGDKEIAIPYLDPRKEEFLEYDLSEALVKLRSGTKPKLGLMSSLPMSSPSHDPRMGDGDWAVLQMLKNSFDVTDLPSDTASIDPAINVLFVVHPKDLKDKTLYAIDQFVMNGGRLLVAVDPFSRVDLAQSQGMGMAGMASGASSDLKTLFAAWDIEYSSDQVIGDMSRGTQINTGVQNITYPVFMTLMDEDINRTHKITSQLKQLLYAEGGSVALKSGSSLKFEPLLETSGDAGDVAGPTLMFQPPDELAARFKGKGVKKTLAAVFSGKFKSAFAAGAPADATKGAELKESKNDNMVIVIADADFMHDSNAVNKMRFGPQIIMSPRNDNLNLVVNAAEFLGGNQDLISIRSSGQIARPFTKVLEIQKQAQARWQEEEDRLSKQLTDLQSKLAMLQRERTDGNRMQLTPSQQKEIEKFRDEERQIRQRRREVRKNLREDIENLGHRLVMANLLLTPTMVAGFGLIVFRNRSRREREEKINAK